MIIKLMIIIAIVVALMGCSIVGSPDLGVGKTGGRIADIMIIFAIIAAIIGAIRK